MGRKYRLKRNGKSIREFNSRQEINDYVSDNYSNSIWDQGNLNELVVTGRKPPEKPKYFIAFQLKCNILKNLCDYQFRMLSYF